MSAPVTPFADPLPEFRTLCGQRRATALSVARQHRQRWAAGSSYRRLVRSLAFRKNRDRLRWEAAERAAVAAAADAVRAVAEVFAEYGRAAASRNP